jgi:hypothetical protein
MHLISLGISKAAIALELLDADSTSASLHERLAYLLLLMDFFCIGIAG